MSYYIYGLRVVGDLECRYVGMTQKSSPQGRLLNLSHTARTMSREKHPDGLWQWLLDNQGNIDAFKIGKVEYADEARAMEKAIIALVLRLGHRLLNVQHVPDDQRIGYVPTGYIQERNRARELRKAA